MKITRKQIRKLIQEQDEWSPGQKDAREIGIQSIEREMESGAMTSDDVVQLVRFGAEMLDDAGADSHELWQAVSEYFWDGNSLSDKPW